ncbi:MAG: enoyl-CoA hydratase, partial [Pseudomonadota bacterium]
MTAASPDDPRPRRGRAFDEIEIGETAALRRTVRADDLFVFANASGNHNPMHLPGPGRDDPVAPAQWVASLISAVVGNRLPGPGALYLAQRFEVAGRAHAGDVLEARVTVRAKGPDRRVTLDAEVVDQTGARVLFGEAVVEAP